MTPAPWRPDRLATSSRRTPEAETTENSARLDVMFAIWAARLLAMGFSALRATGPKFVRFGR